MAEVATVFNENITPYAPGPRTEAEPPVKHVVVVGGGTAGWMTALLLANSDYGPRLQVTVLESPQVGIIGVGEGSTPWLRGFFDGLGIEESEWMPACNATYKNGIRFAGWSTRPGYESYFHPFASMLDNMTMTQFVDNVHRRLEGEDVEAHPDRYFIANRLAEKGLGPRPRHDFPFGVWYAYHFDSVLLGAFLGKKAVERGVRISACSTTPRPRAICACAWGASPSTGIATAWRSACRRVSSSRWKPRPCCSCSAPHPCW